MQLSSRRGDVRAKLEAKGTELRGVGRLRGLVGQVWSNQGIDRRLREVFVSGLGATGETETLGQRFAGRVVRRGDHRHQLPKENRDVVRVPGLRGNLVPAGDHELRPHVLQELRGTGQELSRVLAKDRRC